MTTHPPALVELVTRTLDEVALASVEGAAPIAAIREASLELLDRLVADVVATEAGPAWIRFRAATTPSRTSRATSAASAPSGHCSVTVRAGADFTPAPEGTEPSPAQVWAQLLQMDPDERIRRLDGLLTSAARGHACWLASHDEQIENLRSTIHVTRAELAEARARGGHLLAVTEPVGVVTVPAGTTDEQLAGVRAVVPADVAVDREPLCGECSATHTTAEHIRANLAPLTSASTVEELDREIAWIDKTIEAPGSEAYAETGRHLAAQLREQRDKLAAAERPAPWPDPEVAVDLIDHTDEPVQP